MADKRENELRVIDGNNSYITSRTNIDEHRNLTDIAKAVRDGILAKFGIELKIIYVDMPEKDVAKDVADCAIHILYKNSQELPHASPPQHWRNGIRPVNYKTLCQPHGGKLRKLERTKKRATFNDGLSWEPLIETPQLGNFFEKVQRNGYRLKLNKTGERLFPVG